MFAGLQHGRLLEWLVIVALLGFLVWRQLRQTRWPIAEGTIEGASIERVPDAEGFTHPTLVISYSYVVDGNRYGGCEQSGVWHGVSFYRQWVGMKVRVRYKPGQPETSELLETPSKIPANASNQAS